MDLAMWNGMVKKSWFLDDAYLYTIFFGIRLSNAKLPTPSKQMYSVLTVPIIYPQGSNSGKPISGPRVASPK